MAKAKEAGIFRGQRTRDLVAACLKIAHGTVTAVMDDYDADRETKFEAKPSERGKTEQCLPHRCRLSPAHSDTSRARFRQPLSPSFAFLPPADELELVIIDYINTQNKLEFERWFGTICTTLQAQQGPCVIHMDGASYHKNQIIKSPTIKWKRDEMRVWLAGKGVQFSLSETKAKLMERVTPLKVKPVYQAQKIADKYDHYLLFTPPHHPELQPIELIWSTVKGRIAHDPPKNANDAVDKVLAGLHTIKPKEWVNVYRHVQGFENMYCERARQTAENQLMAAEDKLPL